MPRLKVAAHPMFHFSHPYLLFLSLLIPPVLWLWTRQRRGTVRHPHLGLIAKTSMWKARMAKWGGLLLRAGALLSLVLALSGPRWPDLRTRIVTEGIAIGMIVDVSGSMAEKDFQWDDKAISRLEAVKKVFRLFVKGGKAPQGQDLPGRPTDLISLVVFGARPDSACPLTLSHSVLLSMLDEQEPRSVPGESETNISDAIVLGLHRLESARGQRKILVLLSDGEHNVPNAPSGWTPRQAAQIAKSLEVPVYTIDAAGSGLSGIEPGMEDRSFAIREAGIRTLRQVAEITGGEYFRANNTWSLLDVYRAIDRKERSKIESFQYRRYHEGFAGLALTAFVLLLLVLFLEATVWRRIP